jgi:hypothetical protein
LNARCSSPLVSPRLSIKLLHGLNYFSRQRRNDFMKQRFFIFGVLCLVLPSAMLAQDRRPLMSDGLMLLHGTVESVKTNENALSFEFTGRLSFTFFTAARSDQGRTNVDLKFEVSKLPVVVPKFGRPEDNTNTRPTVINYSNAIEHALHGAESAERVSAVLFRPKISFNINGLIEQVECHHAQITPERH